VKVLDAIREVQIPLLALMLLGGCVTKLARGLRAGSLDAGLGPTALVPLSLRRPMALTMCAVECGLGLGGDATASCIRIGACLLFLVATSTLIELRTVRPDVGCGCFGDFSTAPVGGRTIARSALLAIAALATVSLDGVKVPTTGGGDLFLLGIFCAELLLIGALSPEVGEGLIRLGYSEPCELRDVASARTLVALRGSKQWRRYSGFAASEVPNDMWRELCWRYIVYPSIYEGRPADLVFAVFLQQRRPVIHAALVAADTGLPLPWPMTPTGDGRPSQPRRGRVLRLIRVIAPATSARADMPFSSDL
jgi:hypothetical protein